MWIVESVVDGVAREIARVEGVDSYETAMDIARREAPQGFNVRRHDVAPLRGVDNDPKVYRDKVIWRGRKKRAEELVGSVPEDFDSYNDDQLYGRAGEGD